MLSGIAANSSKSAKVWNSVDRLNKTNIAVWNVTLELASLHKVKIYTIVATDEEPFNSETAVSLNRHL